MLKGSVYMAYCWLWAHGEAKPPGGRTLWREAAHLMVGGQEAKGEGKGLQGDALFQDPSSSCAYPPTVTTQSSIQGRTG